MAKYYPILPAVERSSSPIRKAEPSADTTVAINLRFFEDESKNQAEREYDAHYGRLPEPPEGIVDSKQRIIHKKKRKVRSAIVSRRKSALYEKKLEQELEFRDSVNERLKKKLEKYKSIFEEVRDKIDQVEKDLRAKSEVSPRETVTELKDGPPSRDGSSRGPPLTESPPPRTAPLPSVRSMEKQANTLLASKRQSFRLPGIHEPGDTSQVTFSVGQSP